MEHIGRETTHAYRLLLVRFMLNFTFYYRVSPGADLSTYLVERIYFGEFGIEYTSKSGTIHLSAAGLESRNKGWAYVG